MHGCFPILGRAPGLPHKVYTNALNHHCSGPLMFAHGCVLHFWPSQLHRQERGLCLAYLCIRKGQIAVTFQKVAYFRVHGGMMRTLNDGGMMGTLNDVAPIQTGKQWRRLSPNQFPEKLAVSRPYTVAI